MLLLGPRQVGKSTLLDSLGPDLRIDLAHTPTFLRYARDPAAFAAELGALKRRPLTVFLDEIQKLPALLDDVQVMLDREPKGLRFLVSGSSARKLRKGQANLLPGRVAIHYLHPLLAGELGGDFDLARAMSHGTLPGIWTAESDAARRELLQGYVDGYLREEIQAEALVRDLGGYARLLDLTAAASGNILNLQALCRESGLRYETARRYLEVLHDTLVAFSVPAWSGKERASLVAHPKVFLFDLGVRAALLRRPLERHLEDEKGLLLEHVVAFELARRQSTWPGAKLFHFRTGSGAEVDFVLEIEGALWGIEVKATRHLNWKRSAGFAALAARTTRLERKLVVYLGDRKLELGDAEAVPLEDFLALLPA